MDAAPTELKTYFQRLSINPESPGMKWAITVSTNIHRLYSDFTQIRVGACCVNAHRRAAECPAKVSTLVVVSFPSRRDVRILAGGGTAGIAIPKTQPR